MAKITDKWLKKQEPCIEAYKWFRSKHETDPDKLLNLLITEQPENLDWGNWTVTLKLTKINNVKYAVYAAKQVLQNFEKEFPNDKRPRDAIKAAEKYIKNPTEKNKSVVRSAWYAAESAAWTAESAAWSATRSARSAARSAESAAWTAESAAWSAAESARSAAWSAAKSAAWSAALKEKQIKILKYGVRLLKSQK